MDQPVSATARSLPWQASSAFRSVTRSVSADAVMAHLPAFFFCLHVPNLVNSFRHPSWQLFVCVRWDLLHSPGFNSRIH